MRNRGGPLLCGAAASLLVSTLCGVTVASAATNGVIGGAITRYPLPPGVKVAQLFAGDDGTLWFVTTQSQLGRVSPGGEAQLTGATLPHGTGPGDAPAVIVGAGSEGVWSYADEATAGEQGPCAVALVTPDNVVHHIAVPAPATGSSCGGGATDGSGNLWLSLAHPCGSYQCGQRVSFVAEITPGGSVDLLPPPRPGARPGSVTLGADGAIWVLGGYRYQVLGRYTPSSSTTQISIPTGALDAVYARPDGSFWGVAVRLCTGARTVLCLRAEVFQPGGTTVSAYIIPVAVVLPNTYKTGVAVSGDGSLWEAGAERNEPSRFFRIDAQGEIDRSASFPTAADGSALTADDTLAITPDGVWATASTRSGTDVLLRLLLQS